MEENKSGLAKEPESIKTDMIEEKPQKVPAQAPETPTEEKPVAEGRMKTWARKTFRWSVVVLVIFGLGVIAALVFIYQPTAKKLADAQSQLQTANEKVETLESQVSDLAGVEEDNAALTEILVDTKLRVLILSSLADVYAAQFAMETGNIANARVQLSRTPDTLVSIHDALDPAQQPVVGGMQDRLALVLDEMDDDPFAAQSDLEVLANSLISLENSFFAAP